MSLNQLNINPLTPPKPASEAAADALRDMIVTNKIALGERLSENLLAEKLNVSRTPVREAFMVLETEKMVEVRPKRGTFVFTIDAEEAREICELRAILEIGAMKLAAERNRGALVAKLREIADSSVSALDVSAAAYQPHDIKFHAAIFEFAENANLAESYAKISGRVSSLRWRLTRTLEQVADSHAVHMDIIDALERSDDRRAADLMQDHVGRTYRVIRKLFEADEPDTALLRSVAGG